MAGRIFSVRAVYSLFMIIFAVTPLLAQMQWIWRNPVPAGNPLTAVAGNGNQVVGVGPTGTILVSSDSGTSWTVRNLRLNINYNEVLYNNGRFIILGNLNTVLISDDGGINWSWVNGVPGSVVKVLIGIGAHGNQCVAVASGGLITVSADNGLTWTPSAFTSSSSMNCAIWAGTQFVLLGEKGGMATSLDGLSWTESTITGAETINFKSVAKSGSIYVAVGSDLYGRAYTSVNGTTWTQVTSVRTNGSLLRVVWNGTRFIASGKRGVLLTSPDGFTWSTNTAIAASEDLQGLYSAAGKTIIATSTGSIFSSNNLTSWTNRQSVITRNSLNSVVWDGKEFVAVGDNGLVLTSADGAAWVVNDSTTMAGINLLKVIWTGTKLFAVGGGGTIATSTDAKNWIVLSTGFFDDLCSICYNGSIYIAATGGNTFLTSGDGNTWVQDTVRESDLSPTTQSIAGIGCAGPQFIILSTGSTIFTSNSGTAWTKMVVPTSFPVSFAALACSGRTIAIVGSGRQISTSIDGGSTWHQASIDFEDYGLTDIVWTGYRFVAVGMGGIVMASMLDSETVFQGGKDDAGRYYTGCTKSFMGVAASSDSQLVAVGTEGAIMGSVCPVSEVKHFQPGITAHRINCRVKGARLSFSLPADSKVTARIFGLDGRCVAVIADRFFAEGNHSIDLRGCCLAGGLYQVQLRTNRVSEYISLFIMR